MLEVRRRYVREVLAQWRAFATGYCRRQPNIQPQPVLCFAQTARRPVSEREAKAISRRQSHQDIPAELAVSTIAWALGQFTSILRRHHASVMLDPPTTTSQPADTRRRHCRIRFGSRQLGSTMRRRSVVGNRELSAVLCSTDIARTQEFYEQKVGLKLSTKTIKNHLLFECGNGTTLLVYARPTPNKADHTGSLLVGRRRIRRSRTRGSWGGLRGLRFPDPQDRQPYRNDSRHRQVGLVQGPRRQHHSAVSAGIAARVTTTCIDAASSPDG